MKTKLFLTTILALNFYFLTSQVPQGFNYQAIARDGSGTLITNQILPVKIDIQTSITGGTLIWEEQHSVTTDQYGIITLVVGKGSRLGGAALLFSDIDWNKQPLFLKTSIQYPGPGYTEMGTTQLWAVPYSMVAKDLEGPIEKLGVKGTTDNMEEALFEVKNKNGQTVFAVFNEGVRIYVEDGDSKGAKGGFAIGGFSTTKAPAQEYFVVNADSIRAYIYDDPLVKKPKGGFAIGGFNMAKGLTNDYLLISPDSARVYVNTAPSTKGAKGGFAIGGFDLSKGTNPQKLLTVSDDSIRMYIDKESKGAKGGFAIGGFDQSKAGKEEYLHVSRDSTIISTSNQSKRVSIKNPDGSVPLLNIDGSIKMGYDSIATNGIMGYNGSKFLTYEKSDTAWKQFVVTGIPEVITDSVYNISRNSVSIAGNVIKDGGSEIVARGACWSKFPNPTLMDSSVISGNGKGHYLSDIKGLKGSSTYYLRTFATNSKFTNYSEEQTINTLLPVLPAINTMTVTSITATSAITGGKVTDDGADNITARGVCWNITGTPDILGNHTLNGTGIGVFACSLTSLLANKTYYVRAYATNSIGTIYGEEYSFATTDLPVLSTNPITAVTGTSATTGGNIFAGGELSIIQRGVCWNSSGNPTLEDSHTENGTGTGSFTSNITGLSLGKTYFVRGYAVNSSGVAYGNEYFFTTLNVPTLTTNTVSLVTGTSATCGGNISYNGGAVVTIRGICWNTAGNPTIDDSHINAGDGSGTFSAGMTDLTLGTSYFVRAYATNSIGTAYGNTQSFTTQNYAAITTSAVTTITYTTAISGGNITSDGGAIITQRGICWNTAGTPLITGNHTSDGAGAGIYNSSITGLAANNTYYVRAYAVNSIGTTYGQEVSFSTPTIVPPPPGFPVIGTITVTAGSTGFHTGGYISSDGGSAVTQRGICWGTSSNPTLADNYSNEGTGIGLYNSTIVIAGCGATYYIRAYATNSSGTGYGNQFSVASGLLPYVEETVNITNITKTTAMSGGIITSDGGCSITERGICWNRFPNPTISNYKSISGSGTGTFTGSLTGLFPNDTYHVRAYATNSKGTGYGPELIFTTQAGASGAYIGKFYAGGYVFYLDETGDHGLVCAPPGPDPYAYWGCDGTSIPGTQTIVGSGAANTAIIIANCAEANIAARLCDTYESNGYTDWFLPSLSELALMYNNLCFVGIGGFFGGAYWSSTEYNSGVAWYLSFTSGGGSNTGKSSPARVRAARSF